MDSEPSNSPTHPRSNWFITFHLSQLHVRFTCSQPFPPVFQYPTRATPVLFPVGPWSLSLTHPSTSLSMLRSCKMPDYHVHMHFLSLLYPQRARKVSEGVVACRDLARHGQRSPARHTGRVQTQPKPASTHLCVRSDVLHPLLQAPKSPPRVRVDAGPQQLADRVTTATRVVKDETEPEAVKRGGCQLFSFFSSGWWCFRCHLAGCIALAPGRGCGPCSIVALIHTFHLREAELWRGCSSSRIPEPHSISVFADVTSGCFVPWMMELFRWVDTST